MPVGRGSALLGRQGRPAGPGRGHKGQKVTNIATPASQALTQLITSEATKASAAAGEVAKTGPQAQAVQGEVC